MLLSLERSRVLFVGGKGGVGKTSVASGVALARARAGARVLLVSTDPAHSLGHLWGRPIGDDAVTLATEPGGGSVDGLEIDPDRTVDRHLAAVRATMHRLLPERMLTQADRHLELARQAPGTHESAVLERVAETLETGTADYDLVVYDTAPTGHTLRLLSLPEQLTTWTESLLANRDRAERFGAALRGLGGSTDIDTDAELRWVLTRRQRRYATLRDTVRDADRSSFWIVVTPERLPVAESLALHRQLTSLGIPVGALVVNRRSPADAGPVLGDRRLLEEQQLARLRAEVVGVPIWELPLLAGDPAGPAGVGALADALTGAG